MTQRFYLVRKETLWGNSLRITSPTQVLFFALFVDVFCRRLAGDIIGLRGVEVRRLIVLIALVALVVIPARLPRSVVSDTTTSLADTNIRDNGIAARQTEGSNSSASAIITIAMTGVLDE